MLKTDKHKELGAAASQKAETMLAGVTPTKAAAKNLADESVSAAGKELEALNAQAIENEQATGEAVQEAEQNTEQLAMEQLVEQLNGQITVLEKAGAELQEAGNPEVEKAAKLAREQFEAENYEKAQLYANYSLILTMEVKEIPPGSALEELLVTKSETLLSENVNEREDISSKENALLIERARIEIAASTAESTREGVEKAIGKGRGYSEEELQLAQDSVENAKLLEHKAETLLKEGRKLYASGKVMDANLKYAEASENINASMQVMGVVAQYDAAVDARKGIRNKGYRKEAEAAVGHITSVLKGKAPVEEALTASAFVQQLESIENLERFNASRKGYTGKAGERLEKAAKVAEKYIVSGKFAYANWILSVGTQYKATYEKSSYRGFAKAMGAKKDEANVDLQKKLRKAGVKVKDDKLSAARKKYGRALDLLTEHKKESDVLKAEKLIRRASEDSVALKNGAIYGEMARADQGALYEASQLTGGTRPKTEKSEDAILGIMVHAARGEIDSAKTSYQAGEFRRALDADRRAYANVQKVPENLILVAENGVRMGGQAEQCGELGFELEETADDLAKKKTGDSNVDSSTGQIAGRMRTTAGALYKNADKLEMMKEEGKDFVRNAEGKDTDNYEFAEKLKGVLSEQENAMAETDNLLMRGTMIARVGSETIMYRDRFMGQGSMSMFRNHLDYEMAKEALPTAIDANQKTVEHLGGFRPGEQKRADSGWRWEQDMMGSASSWKRDRKEAFTEYKKGTKAASEHLALYSHSQARYRREGEEEGVTQRKQYYAMYGKPREKAFAIAAGIRGPQIPEAPKRPTFERTNTPAADRKKYDAALAKYNADMKAYSGKGGELETYYKELKKSEQYLAAVGESTQTAFQSADMHSSPLDPVLPAVFAAGSKIDWTVLIPVVGVSIALYNSYERGGLLKKGVKMKEIHQSVGKSRFELNAAALALADEQGKGRRIEISKLRSSAEQAMETNENASRLEDGLKFVAAFAGGGIGTAAFGADMIVGTAHAFKTGEGQVKSTLMLSAMALGRAGHLLKTVERAGLLGKFLSGTGKVFTRYHDFTMVPMMGYDAFHGVQMVSDGHTYEGVRTILSTAPFLPSMVAPRSRILTSPIKLKPGALRKGAVQTWNKTVSMMRGERVSGKSERLVLPKRAAVKPAAAPRPVEVKPAAAERAVLSPEVIEGRARDVDGRIGQLKKMKLEAAKGFMKAPPKSAERAKMLKKRQEAAEEIEALKKEKVVLEKDVETARQAKKVADLNLEPKIAEVEGKLARVEKLRAQEKETGARSLERGKLEREAAEQLRQMELEVLEVVGERVAVGAEGVRTIPEAFAILGQPPGGGRPPLRMLMKSVSSLRSYAERAKGAARSPVKVVPKKQPVRDRAWEKTGEAPELVLQEMVVGEIKYREALGKPKIQEMRAVELAKRAWEEVYRGEKPLEGLKGEEKAAHENFKKEAADRFAELSETAWTEVIAEKTGKVIDLEKVAEAEKPVHARMKKVMREIWDRNIERGMAPEKVAKLVNPEEIASDYTGYLQKGFGVPKEFFEHMRAQGIEPGKVLMDGESVTVLENPTLTVVVGDMHADLVASVSMLKGSGLVIDTRPDLAITDLSVPVKERYRWNSEAPEGSVLVQTGDREGRGANSLEVEDLFWSLKEQAEARGDGSRVVLLAGNHEALSLKIIETCKNKSSAEMEEFLVGVERTKKLTHEYADLGRNMPNDRLQELIRLNKEGVNGDLIKEGIIFGTTGFETTLRNIRDRYSGQTAPGKGWWETALLDMNRPDGYITRLNNLKYAAYVKGPGGTALFTHAGPVLTAKGPKEMEAHFNKMRDPAHPERNHWATNDLGSKSLETAQQNGDFSSGYVGKDWSIHDPKVQAWMNAEGNMFVGHRAMEGITVQSDGGVTVVNVDGTASKGYWGKRKAAERHAPGEIVVMNHMDGTATKVQGWKEKPGETVRKSRSTKTEEIPVHRSKQAKTYEKWRKGKEAKKLETLPDEREVLAAKIREKAVAPSPVKVAPSSQVPSILPKLRVPKDMEAWAKKEWGLGWEKFVDELNGGRIPERNKPTFRVNVEIEGRTEQWTLRIDGKQETAGLLGEGERYTVTVIESPASRKVPATTILVDAKGTKGFERALAEGVKTNYETAWKATGKRAMAREKYVTAEELAEYAESYPRGKELPTFTPIKEMGGKMINGDAVNAAIEATVADLAAQGIPMDITVVSCDKTAMNHLNPNVEHSGGDSSLRANREFFTNLAKNATKGMDKKIYGTYIYRPFGKGDEFYIVVVSKKGTGKNLNRKFNSKMSQWGVRRRLMKKLKTDPKHPQFDQHKDLLADPKMYVTGTVETTTSTITTVRQAENFRVSKELNKAEDSGVISNFRERFNIGLMDKAVTSTERFSGKVENGIAVEIAFTIKHPHDVEVVQNAAEHYKKGYRELYGSKEILLGQRMGNTGAGHEGNNLLASVHDGAMAVYEQSLPPGWKIRRIGQIGFKYVVEVPKGVKVIPELREKIRNGMEQIVQKALNDPVVFFKTWGQQLSAKPELGRNLLNLSAKLKVAYPKGAKKGIELKAIAKVAEQPVINEGERFLHARLEAMRVNVVGLEVQPNTFRSANTIISTIRAGTREMAALKMGKKPKLYKEIKAIVDESGTMVRDVEDFVAYVRKTKPESADRIITEFFEYSNKYSDHVLMDRAKLETAALVVAAKDNMEYIELMPPEIREAVEQSKSGMELRDLLAFERTSQYEMEGHGGVETWRIFSEWAAGEGGRAFRDAAAKDLAVLKKVKAGELIPKGRISRAKERYRKQGGWIEIPVPKSLAPKEMIENYAGKNVAMQSKDGILVYDYEYLLGKHGKGGEAAGSKLGNVKTPEQLAELLRNNVDMKTLAKTEGVTRIANVEAGEVTGTDSMVEITSIKKGGKEVGVGGELKEGVEYEATIKDANGVEHPAIVRYEVVRPGSPDGKFAPTMQAVAYTLAKPPASTKMNVVIGKIDLADARAEWVNTPALKKRLGDKAVDGAKGIYSIFTIFPGKYAPAADARNGPLQDATVGMTGHEFWNGRKAAGGKSRVNRHALMKKPTGEMAERLGGKKVGEPEPRVVEAERAKAARPKGERVVPEKGYHQAKLEGQKPAETAVEAKKLTKAEREESWKRMESLEDALETYDSYLEEVSVFGLGKGKSKMLEAQADALFQRGFETIYGKKIKTMNRGEMEALIAEKKLNLKKAKAMPEEKGLPYGQLTKTHIAKELEAEIAYLEGQKPALMKKPSREMAERLGGEKAASREWAPAKAIEAEKAEILADLHRTLETKGEDGNPVPQGRISGIEVIKPDKVFKCKIKTKDGKETDVIFTTGDFRQQKIGLTMYQAVGETALGYAFLDGKLALQEIMGAKDLKDALPKASPKERQELFRLLGRQGVIDYALGVPDAHWENYRVWKTESGWNLARIDLENSGLGWGKQGRYHLDYYHKFAYTLKASLKLGKYTPGEIQTFVQGLREGIDVVKRMDGKKVMESVAKYEGTPLKQEGNVFTRKMREGIGERIEEVQSHPERLLHIIEASVSAHVKETFKTGLKAGMTNIGDNPFVMEWLGVIKEEVPSAGLRALIEWKRDVHSMLNLSEGTPPKLIKEIETAMDQRIKSKLSGELSPFDQKALLDWRDNTIKRRNVEIGDQLAEMVEWRQGVHSILELSGKNPLLLEIEGNLSRRIVGELSEHGALKLNLQKRIEYRAELVDITKGAKGELAESAKRVSEELAEMIMAEAEQKVPKEGSVTVEMVMKVARDISARSKGELARRAKALEAKATARSMELEAKKVVKRAKKGKTLERKTEIIKEGLQNIPDNILKSLRDSYKESEYADRLIEEISLMEAELKRRNA